MLTLATILAAISLTAPEWAAPANTLLLIVLTVITHRVRAKTSEIKDKADQIHTDVNSAAAAALAAAEAAAHAAVASQDTARISRQLGGTIRRTELPEQ